MVSEFDGQGRIKIKDRMIVEPKFFGAYALFSIQKEWIESGKDDLTREFGEHLVNDTVLNPVAGPEQVDQYARWKPIEDWLGESLTYLRQLVWSIQYGSPDLEPEHDGQEPVRERIRNHEEVVRLRDLFLTLQPEQRAVVMYLHAIHRGPVLFPMTLVLGRCTPAEYAQGVMASQFVLAGVFGDVDEAEHRQSFEELRADARTALEYVTRYREGTPDHRIRSMVEAGESGTVEFKSSLRWNIHSQRNDDDITHSCIKTIAAFLNSDGGKLLIGVADDGSIFGIENDGFPNNDK